MLHPSAISWVKKGAMGLLALFFTQKSSLYVYDTSKMKLNQDFNAWIKQLTGIKSHITTPGKNAFQNNETATTQLNLWQSHIILELCSSVLKLHINGHTSSAYLNVLPFKPAKPKLSKLKDHVHNQTYHDKWLRFSHK